MTYSIIQGDAYFELAKLSSKKFSFFYIDPPFNTGKMQTRQRIEVRKADSSVSDKKEREGFGGARYEVINSKKSPVYLDSFESYPEFLMNRIKLAVPLLKDDGCFFVHLDWREVHQIKVLLDQLMGKERFLNEIIWSYDYGAKSKRKWPTKHDTILCYVMDPKNYTFNRKDCDRLPYKAPSLVTEEKRKKGKFPTDVWEMTIVPTNSKEKTGYPTQKPIHLLERLVKVHSNPGDHLLDFFAGSGTLGDVALKNKRKCTLIDVNQEAVEIMKKRLGKYK